MEIWHVELPTLSYLPADLWKHFGNDDNDHKKFPEWFSDQFVIFLWFPTWLVWTLD